MEEKILKKQGRQGHRVEELNETHCSSPLLLDKPTFLCLSRRKNICKTLFLSSFLMASIAAGHAACVLATNPGFDPGRAPSTSDISCPTCMLRLTSTGSPRTPLAGLLGKNAVAPRGGKVVSSSTRCSCCATSAMCPVSIRVSRTTGSYS